MLWQAAGRECSQQLRRIRSILASSAHHPPSSRFVIALHCLQHMLCQAVEGSQRGSQAHLCSTAAILAFLAAACSSVSSLVPAGMVRPPP